jgi:phage protein D
MIKVPETQVEISLGGADVTAGLESQLIAWTHTDSLKKQSDTIGLTLWDENWQFLTQWIVPKGTPIKAAIIHDNQRLECGSFWIDDIHFSIGQSGSTLELKANSVPPGGSGKGTKQYRAWEGADLKTISDDLARDSDLELDWQIENPPKLSRVDQDGESNLEMINRLADENGGQVTVKNGKLIVYDEQIWEQREPSFEISPRAFPYESIKLHTTAVGKFAGSQESWTSPRTGRTVDEDFIPEEKPEGAGAKLKNYRRYNRAGDDDEDIDDPDSPLGRDYEWELGPQAIAESKGDRKTKAATRAKKELRKANRDEWIVDLSNMPGSIRMNAGLTFTLSQEFGKFARKYIIDQVTHTVSRSGYKTSIKGRGVLKGY